MFKPKPKTFFSLKNQEDDGDGDGGVSRSSSFLVVEDARSSDTGSYRCASDAGESEPTDIHIINGTDVECRTLRLKEWGKTYKSIPSN